MIRALDAMALLARLAAPIAANTVILAGFFRGGWSPGTVLALYWFQTLIAIPLTAILVVLHRRKTRKLGHYELAPASDGKIVVKPSGFLASFLLITTVFSLAHGVALGVILFLMLKGAGAVDAGDVRVGLAMLATVLLVSFLVDVAQLRSRPFAWIRQRTEGLQARVGVMHFVIIFGMAAAAFMKDEAIGFFGVFVVLKLFADIAAELPPWDPQQPPRWIAWLGRKSGKTDTDMASEWKRMRLEQREGFARAERTLDEALAERAP